MNCNFFISFLLYFKKTKLPALLFFLLPWVFIQTSCKKLVQVDPPINSIITQQVFADSADATAAVIGMYAKLAKNYTTLTTGSISPGIGFQTGGITLYTSLAADELYANVANSSYQHESPFYANAILSSSTFNYTNMWQAAYTVIYDINACLEGLGSSNTALVFSTKNQLRAECKVARAFMYFNLVNIYGDVPLVLTTNYETNAVLPRASVNDVYEQIIADLTSAQTSLPQTYLTTGRGRVNYYVATALLSRVYLYRKQWALAEAAATQIINAGQYSLSPLNNVFLSNIITTTNKEPIWQWFPTSDKTGGYETYEGQIFVALGGVVPNYIISDSLLNSFEVNDQRKNNWLKANTVGIGVQAKTYYFPYKYKLQNDGTIVPKELYVVLRLGEQYLIRSEARAQQGTDLTGAANDLNMIRTRAGLPNTTASTPSDLLTAIYRERRLELCCEYGHRWFDLKRTGLINAVMGGSTGACATKGGTWSTNWQLFPIPFDEIQRNPFLTQNTGY